ncbi:hypothetical protein QUF74_11625 [Candidatus Halobeggiatoa sp. HSG11]|nr:hypothetical protein [Candidatus Halobeggiatoa sp. HSG11]
MSQFLWVEDFQSNGEKIVPTFTNAVFGEILDKEPEDTKEKLRKTLKNYNVLLECTFLDALEFIRDPNNLFQVDYIILDIDLTLKEDIDENNLLPKILELYKNEKDPKAALKAIAGYQLYIELVMGLDFPKEHILFCSNHINHLNSLKDAFEKAKIQLPPTSNDKLALSKSDPSDIEALQGWVREHRNNPYSVLRRGIIEGCQYIKDNLSGEILFSLFCDKKKRQNVTVQNMRDYLETLQNFLPIRKPSDIKVKQLYKLLVRTISHEWEDDFNPNNLKSSDITDKNILKRQKMFGSIIKCTRNWTAHTKIFDDLCERDVAFLFIVAMRAMFKLSDKTERYESLLLNLFTDKLSKQEILPKNHSDILLQSHLQLLKTSAKVLKKKNKLLQPANQNQLDFSSILKNTQYFDKNNEEQFDYLTGLFQMFWHDLSPIEVKSFTPTLQDQQKILLEYEYDFVLYDFDDTDSFLFELARNIYKRSFTEIS